MPTAIHLYSTKYETKKGHGTYYLTSRQFYQTKCFVLRHIVYYRHFTEYTAQTVPRFNRRDQCPTHTEWAVFGICMLSIKF